MNWQDRTRTEPTLRRITKQDGTYEDVYITDIPSNVTNEGTPVNSANMQYLDDGMSGNKANIGASEYTVFSTISTYDVGDVVIYNNIIYKCIVAVTTPGSFKTENWETYSIKKMFEDKEQELQDLATQLQQDIKDNVINALTSNLTDRALSANQGKILNGKIADVSPVVLYSNDTVRKEATEFTLNDDITKYNRVKFFAKDGNSYECAIFTEIVAPKVNDFFQLISIHASGEHIEEDEQGYVIRYSICKFRITANNRITPQDGWAGWIRREDQDMTFHHVLETPIYKVLGFIN